MGGAVADIGQNVDHLKDVSKQLAEFNVRLTSVESDVQAAMASAEKIAGAATGIGKVKENIAIIKAKAEHVRRDIGLAKRTIDEAMPQPKIMTVGLATGLLASAAPSAPRICTGSRRASPPRPSRQVAPCQE